MTCRTGGCQKEILVQYNDDDDYNLDANETDWDHLESLSGQRGVLVNFDGDGGGGAYLGQSLLLGYSIKISVMIITYHQW